MTWEVLDSFRGKAQPTSLDHLDNRDLLRAIDGVARGDSPENRQNLYRTLLDVISLVPVPELPVNVARAPSVATLAEPLKLPVLHDKEGQKFIPAFSDLEALRNWDPNAPYIGVNSIDLFKAALSSDVDHIAINLFDPIRKMIRPGGTVTRQEFQLLAEGRLPSGVVGPAISFEVKKDQEIFIGVPAKEPAPEIMEALLSTARVIQKVAALYLAQIGEQQDRQWVSQTVLGIELSEDVPPSQKEAIVEKLGESVRPLLPQNQFLDFTFTDGSLGEVIKSRCKLVYRRATQ